MMDVIATREWAAKSKDRTMPNILSPHHHCHCAHHHHHHHHHDFGHDHHHHGAYEDEDDEYIQEWRERALKAQAGPIPKIGSRLLISPPSSTPPLLYPKRNFPQQQCLKGNLGTRVHYPSYIPKHRHRRNVTSHHSFSLL